MIIQSILDTDLYKFSMSYAYQQLFPEAIGEYKFIDRAKTHYDENFLKMLELHLAEMCFLSLSEVEKKEAFGLLGSWIPLHYWEWLKNFRFERDKIKIHLMENGELEITVEDYLYKATLYEVPLLALISEVRNKWLGYTYNEKTMVDKLEDKIKVSNEYQLKFSEFGTRRRFSYPVQEKVCEILKEKSQYYLGTSNVYLALKTGVKAYGSMGHEYISTNTAFFGYRMGNYMAMENWMKVYDGNLGCFLADCNTHDIFFKNLSRKHALLFQTLRHDSGDPYKFISMAAKRYRELGIDPKTKDLLFSNALTMPEFRDIAEAGKGLFRIILAGIGTNLTNDTGNPPANIVMKLWKVRMSERQPWIFTVKLSDDPGKATGDEKEVQLAKLTLGLI